MVWDLATLKGMCHLAKVSTIPVSGLMNQTIGTPSFKEFILGPNHKWHTDSYQPVDSTTGKALFDALDEYKVHEQRVGQKLRLEAEERVEQQKLKAQLKTLQNSEIVVSCKTRDGKKLLQTYNRWDILVFLEKEGWTTICSYQITLFKEISSIGTHQFWVQLGDDDDPTLRTEVTLVVKPEAGDAERREKEKEKEHKKIEAAKRKRIEAAAKKKIKVAKRKPEVVIKKKTTKKPVCEKTYSKSTTRNHRKKAISRI